MVILLSIFWGYTQPFFSSIQSRTFLIRASGSPDTLPARAGRKEKNEREPYHGPLSPLLYDRSSDLRFKELNALSSLRRGALTRPHGRAGIVREETAPCQAIPTARDSASLSTTGASTFAFFLSLPPSSHRTLSPRDTQPNASMSIFSVASG